MAGIFLIMANQLSIELQKVGKRFGREWIFKGVDYTFEWGKSYAITGRNGSGKSTLLKVMSGIEPPSAGKVLFHKDGKLVPEHDYFRELSYCAPYQELVEEFTLKELLAFHFSLQGIKPDINQMMADMWLESSANKAISHFSSGMKQRVRLYLAFHSQKPIILLDEPTVNLDKEGIAWYREQVEKKLKNHLVVICSNEEREYDFCDEIFDVNR